MSECDSAAVCAVVFRDEDNVRYKIYADGIYSTGGYIVAPPKARNLSQAQKSFNQRMSSMRVSVEWMVAKIYKVCALLRDETKQRLRESDLKTRFFVGALLTNCHTCLYGSQASMYFRCESPILEDYLRGMFPPLEEADSEEEDGNELEDLSQDDSEEEED